LIEEPGTKRLDRFSDPTIVVEIKGVSVCRMQRRCGNPEHDGACRRDLSGDSVTPDDWPSGRVRESLTFSVQAAQQEPGNPYQRLSEDRGEGRVGATFAPRVSQLPAGKLETVLLASSKAAAGSRRYGVLGTTDSPLMTFGKALPLLALGLQCPLNPPRSATY
jgi:hypothetical protein